MTDSYFLIAFLQTHLEPLDGVLRTISECVYFHYYLLVCAILFWYDYRRVAIRLACMTLFSTLLFSGLKQFFLSPRPYMDYPDLFNGWKENQWGMPSGHSQNAMVFWGISAITAPSRLFKIVAITLIALIGISRLYLGVHYLSQVLAGFAIGLGLILIYCRFATRFLDWFNQQPIRQRLTSALILVHLPWVLTVAVHKMLGMSLETAMPYQKMAFYSGLIACIALPLILSAQPNSTHQPRRWFSTKALFGIIPLAALWLVHQFISGLTTASVTQPSLYYLIFWLQGGVLSLWACCLWPKLHDACLKKA